LSGEFRMSPRIYIPPTLTLTLTWLLAYISRMARMSYPRPIIAPMEEPAPTTPPPQALTSPAPYLNTLLIIGLIAASGVVILYIARRRPLLVKIIISALIWLISFGITTIYLINIALAFNPILISFWIPVGILAASTITYLIFSESEMASIIAASYIASGAGGTIGMSMPYWTFLILTIGISIYDVLAVYKGHLSTLTKGEAPSLKGITVEVGDLVIGLGDLFFYSLTTSAIFWNLGHTPAVVGMIWIIMGFGITLYCLRKRRIVPGLPIPLLGALALAFVVKMIMAP